MYPTTTRFRRVVTVDFSAGNWGTEAVAPAKQAVTGADVAAPYHRLHSPI